MHTLKAMNMEDVQEIQRKKQMERIEDNKLIKDIKANKDFGRRNKDKFMEGEKRFSTCTMYEPCPICDKCLNKASHLYVRCQNCGIPICTHTYKDKQYMIRRHNFTLDIDKETENKIRELGKKYEK